MAQKDQRDLMERLEKTAMTAHVDRPVLRETLALLERPGNQVNPARMVATAKTGSQASRVRTDYRDLLAFLGRVATPVNQVKPGHVGGMVRKGMSVPAAPMPWLLACPVNLVQVDHGALLVQRVNRVRLGRMAVQVLKVKSVALDNMVAKENLEWMV